MQEDTEFGLSQVSRAWRSAAGELVKETPLHLLSEQEFRRAFALILFDRDGRQYSQPEHLQFEKIGNGVPPRRPVDLYFEMRSDCCFVEFKYWHTMVKVRDGRRQVGKGNNTFSDVHKWVNDLDKLLLLRIDNPRARRWFLLVAQLNQYEGSNSRLLFEVLESQRPDLSPRHLADKIRADIRLADDLWGSVDRLFETLIARSPEGIRFGIYGLELRPTEQ